MNENISKIKYILVVNKIYEVISINWPRSELEAKEIDLAVGDVEESELWDISYLGDFRIRLMNWKGIAEIVDFEEWVKEYRE